MKEHKSIRLVSNGPVRPIGTNRRSITGQVSIGLDAVRFESALERDFLVLLDFDLSVERVQGQPAHIYFKGADGADRRYTPDFLVDYFNGNQILYEVKYRSNLKQDWASLKPRFRAAIRYAKEHNARFSIVTEVEIRDSAYLPNVKFLRPFRDYAHVPAIEGHLLQVLLALGETTPEALLAAAYWTVDNRIKAVASLWRLVSLGRIHVDLYVPLTMGSSIWTTADEVRQ